jgi:hypothetical protein
MSHKQVEQTDLELDYLVSTGSITNYFYKKVYEYGEEWEALEIILPDGASIIIRSHHFIDSSQLSISTTDPTR